MITWRILFAGKKKPSRPCIFCGIFFSDLRRHILTVHRKVPRVKDILDKFKAGQITRRDKLTLIEQFRKEGMFLKNAEMISQGCTNVDQLICRKKSSGTKVMCSSCKGMYNAKTFNKHRFTCVRKEDQPKPRSPLAETSNCTQSKSSNDNDQQWLNLIKHMRRDDYHQIIIGDEMIQRIGKEIFCSRKPNKKREAKNKARSAMRRLARLVELTEGVENAEELFKVENFYKLEEAIEKMCQADKSSAKRQKAGLKIALGSLIKSSCINLKAHYIITNQKEKAMEVNNFQDVFKSSYRKLFATAEYELKEKRQRENRKPRALPDEKDLHKLRMHLVDKISEMSQKTGLLSKNEYVALRRLSLARLTLLISRRGGEPARLQLLDWEERDSWISKKSTLAHGHKELVKKYVITYVMGKGTSLVPVICPKSCVTALEILADKDNGRNAGVAADNDFLFAYTEESEDCPLGYNEIRTVCEDINIPVITATAMRHRFSTNFWQMEGTSQQTIDTFMEHMGHSESIDRNVYACPTALKVLTHLTPVIECLDQVSKCPFQSLYITLK